MSDESPARREQRNRAAKDRENDANRPRWTRRRTVFRTLSRKRRGPARIVLFPDPITKSTFFFSSIVFDVRLKRLRYNLRGNRPNRKIMSRPFP